MSNSAPIYPIDPEYFARVFKSVGSVALLSGQPYLICPPEIVRRAQEMKITTHLRPLEPDATPPAPETSATQGVDPTIRMEFVPYREINGERVFLTDEECLETLQIYAHALEIFQALKVLAAMKNVLHTAYTLASAAEQVVAKAEGKA